MTTTPNMGIDKPTLGGDAGACLIYGKKRAMAALITHCPHGHEYTPENTRLKAGTRTRMCRQCDRDYAARKKTERTIGAST